MTSSSPLISIIVPVYNVEPYLRRCVDSVVKQSYTNLEIILVDDGSFDNCPQICDEYAAKDNRIIVIHKKNGGLSDARNAGLDICKGEYISFVDSDDWVNEKYVEKLFGLMIKENADIAIGENLKTDGKISTKRENIVVKSYSTKDALLHLFRKTHIAFVISCGKLYKRELFNLIRFPVGKFHEDEFTTYILFYNSKKITYTSEILYFYYQRSGSIVSSRHPWDVLDFLEQRYLFFKKRKEYEMFPFLLPPLCWQLLCAFWYLSVHKERNSTEYLNRLRKYTKDYKYFKTSKFHMIPLIVFSNIPQLYLFYRKCFPIHIRKDF